MFWWEAGVGFGKCLARAFEQHAVAVKVVSTQHGSGWKKCLWCVAVIVSIVGAMLMFAIFIA